MSYELDAAIQQIKAGQTASARQLLIASLHRNARDEAAWMWLSSVVEDDNQRRDCLEHALSINPANEAARLQLNQMQPVQAYHMAREFGFQPAGQRGGGRAGVDNGVETKLVTLTCPSCGAGLQITPDNDLFVCPACGNSHVVRRSAGMVALEPVLEQMREMQHDVERASKELNIYHLNDSIAALEKAKIPHNKGLEAGIKVVLVAVIILVFFNMVFIFQPLIYLALMMLFGGLAWTSFHFIKQRQLETQIQMKHLQIVRERNM